MKKLWKFVPLFAGLVCLLFLVPRTANAAADVVINSTNFPDSIFRQYVKDNFDGNHDNRLSSEEIEKVQVIDVTSKGIGSLKGVEYFTKLESLTCPYNNLTSLDLSQNSELWNLFCYNNPITGLDLSHNKELRQLICVDMQLSSLNIKNCTKLTDLLCSNNQLKSLNISRNTALQYLFANKNQLSALNVRANTELLGLEIEYNKLTSLDVSKNTKLTSLYLSGNNITGLDVSMLPELKTLAAADNALTSLDVSYNTKLETLVTEGNSLTELDIGSCPVLLDLYQTGEKNDNGDYMSHVYISEDSLVFRILTYDKATKLTGPTENPFTDVKESDSYFKAVMWAVENGITKGTDATHFSPHADCTRYQFAVMLYKLNGQPEVSGSLPFTDVKKTDSYYKAVLWAYKNGIISGTSKTTFSPKAGITRYQVVQMLYKTAGKPAVSGTLSFEDVPTTASYYNAVRWAVQKGITKGTDSAHFSPKAVCKRYQLVVFLYKFNNIYHIK